MNTKQRIIVILFSFLHSMIILTSLMEVHNAKHLVSKKDTMNLSRKV